MLVKFFVFATFSMLISSMWIASVVANSVPSGMDRYYLPYAVSAHIGQGSSTLLYGTYTVFWLDTWGGTASPMGTRMYHIDGDNMGWKKKHAASTPQNLAVPVYPNPVGPDAWISIQLVSVREQHARVFITDALGRTVAELHDGVVREGLTSIAVGLPRGQLPSGTYFVSMFSASGRTLTSFIVLR